MVRKGYKQTEIGVIPDDWDYDSLQDKVDLISGRHILAQKYNSGGIGTPYLTGPADFKDGTSIVSKWTEEKGVEAEYGNVLITVKGSGAGSSFNLDLSKAVISRQLMAIKGKKILQNYLFYIIKNKESELSAKAVGNLIPGLSRTDIFTLKVLLPSAEEQRSIAQALSDVDALIAALNKLIAKKRNLKTATMQQLLTGKKRLPGFGEGQGYKESAIGLIPKDWDVSSLSELCSAIVDGTHYTPSYVADGIPFYSVENVTANEFENTKYISNEEHLRLIRRCKPEKGDLLLTRIGSLGATKLIDWNINASIYVSLALLKLNEKAYPNYVYVYSKSEQFLKDVEKRSLTNATPQKINMGDVGNVPISIPLNQKEQQAIATVLSDMDAEIATLETRLAKTQTIKQGMMQELLTGRTRLV